MATKAELELQDRMKILEIEEIEKQENKEDVDKMKNEKKEDPKNSETIHMKYYKAYHERREKNTKVINEIYANIKKRNANMEGGEHDVIMLMLLEMKKQLSNSKQEMKTLIDELKQDNQELKEELNKKLDKEITEMRDDFKREKIMFENEQKLKQNSKEDETFKHLSWANVEIIGNEFKYEEVAEIPTLMENQMQLEFVTTVQEDLLTARKLEVQFNDKNSQRTVVKEHVHGYKNLIESQKLEIQKLKLQLLSRKELPKINDKLGDENSFLKIQNKLLGKEIQKINSVKLINEKIQSLDGKIIQQNSRKIIDENIIKKLNYKGMEIILENFIQIKEFGYFANEIKNGNFKKKKKFISDKNSKIKRIKKWKHAKFHYMQISGTKKHKIKKTFEVFNTKFGLNSLRKITNLKKKRIKTVTWVPKTKFGKKELKTPTEEWASITETTITKNIKCKMKKW